VTAMAAYECDRCGGLVYIGDPEDVERYGGPHVCNRAVLAEKRFMADPHAEWPKELEP